MPRGVLLLQGRARRQVLHDLVVEVQQVLVVEVQQVHLVVEVQQEHLVTLLPRESEYLSTLGSTLHQDIQV